MTIRDLIFNQILQKRTATIFIFQFFCILNTRLDMMQYSRSNSSRWSAQCLIEQLLNITLEIQYFDRKICMHMFEDDRHKALASATWAHLNNKLVFFFEIFGRKNNDFPVNRHEYLTFNL